MEGRCRRVREMRKEKGQVHGSKRGERAKEEERSRQEVKSIERREIKKKFCKFET